MTRVLVLALLMLAVLPAAASAHPLGNFSVNHLAEVSVSSDRVDVRYILDEAEIPTFQQRGVADAELLRRKRDEVARRLVLTVDGRRVPLRPAGAGSLTHPRGQGGLDTTRVELPLAAAVDAPRRVTLRDGTFPGRVGWKAIVTEPGRGTAVRSSAPTSDPTGELQRYPDDVLDSPSDLRSATLDVRPGSGTVEATGATQSVATGERSAEEGLTAVFSDAADGKGVLLLLLVTAFAWGALHALSPGHGKAMVAAYLVGTRGTPRHALALGATVTAAHTAGVFALGGVALLLSQYVLPEQLYPWLNLASGALVLLVGAAVLRSRVRAAKMHAHEQHHHHHHTHDHSHSHAVPERFSWRGLVAMGAAAGLIPCPSALVVLLGAIAQGQIALGMLLIVAFSAGLAATLTLLGLAVVWAGRALGRVPVPRRLVLALPTVSALLIVGVGVVLTVQAVPQVA
jgi:nickel/cobalt exporter